MRNIFYAFFVIFVVNISIGQTTKKVLFLGNSYTYVNNLPVLLDSLASSNGDVLIKDQNTPGGYTLEGHSTNSTSLAKISSQDWDFVILQDQSQRPSFPPSQVETDVFPYGEILNDSIVSNNQCTETLFFMTWGRQNGDQDNCPYYAPLCTYEGMQQRLRESYLQMGVDNMASVAPVGVAWENAREITGDTINLYSTDGSHPSIYGSYLAACVFYASIFDKSPIGIAYNSTLPETTALLLQTIANNVVFDSSYVWNLRTADYGVAYTESYTVSFKGSENYISETWNFDDGSSVSTEHNPTHIFPDVGDYYVKHIVETNCGVDTIISLVTPMVTLNVNDLESGFSIYPNPATNNLQILYGNKQLIGKVQIVDITGNIVKTFHEVNTQERLFINDLENGIYFIKINNHIEKFVKN